MAWNTSITNRASLNYLNVNNSRPPFPRDIAVVFRGAISRGCCPFDRANRTQRGSVFIVLLFFPANSGGGGGGVWMPRGATDDYVSLCRSHRSWRKDAGERRSHRKWEPATLTSYGECSGSVLPNNRHLWQKCGV